MSRKLFSRFAVCAIASVAVLGLSAGAASAKTLKVTMSSIGKPNSPLDNIAATLSSKQLGKGKQTGYVELPKSFYTWKFTSGPYKGATIKATGSSAGLEGTKVKDGKWKITKGSGKGKLKGATGGGTVTGDIATGKFVFKGTVKVK